MTATTSEPAPPKGDGGSRLLRRGGALLLIGFLAYGAMFVSFGITDTDPFEVLGGVGWMIAGLGAWFVTRGIAERWST